MNNFFNQIIKEDSILALDFDGVFLDSLELKGEAFADLFVNNESRVRKDIINHHLNNPSLTRNEKIKIYYSWFNKKKISFNILNRLLNTFAKDVSGKILKIKPSKFILGLLKFRLESSNYIITRSIEDEVSEYLYKYSLDKYIRRIYDCKYKKTEALILISECNGVNPEQITFIGDSVQDKESADLVGSKFIFYKNGLLKNEDYFL